MKRFVPIILVLLVFACTSKIHESFKITGNIKNLSDGKVLLKKFAEGNWKTTDTAVVKSGSFIFTGKVEVPEMYRIMLADTLTPISVFVDNNEIAITGVKDSLSEVKISGSKVQEEYDNFRFSQKTYKNKLDSLYSEYNKAKDAGNKAFMSKIDSIYEKVTADQSHATRSYVVANKSSVISAYLTWSSLVYETNLNTLDSITAAFDSTLNKSIYVMMLKDYISILKKVEIGQPAVDFTMNDVDGKPVVLSSLYGKYLLVDFWASWCSPCRQENPNVVEAYKKFNTKGFNVLGVSFDNNKESWLKAIKDDKLTWNHVSDLKKWDNAAGKLYGIRSIPSNILLDPKGVIIAKNLRGENLQKKLAELLK